MPTIRLPNNWRPRPYQQPAWNAWERGTRYSLLVWHRRAGKDDVSLHKAAVAAHERPANYWHCLPKYEQARKAIWEAVNPRTGKKRIDEAFPLALRKRTDSQSMTIEFKVGSVWRVVGSDNPDSLVGAPPAGIVFSEWALSNPTAWGLLSPIIMENKGWADFITTPRGRNHVKTMLDGVKNDPRWFTQVLTVNDTGGIISAQDIEDTRRDYRAIFGQDAADALIEQEFYCSFEAAVLGSYYGKEMVRAEQQGRITHGLYDPTLPVYTAWDLGVSDATAIWFFQQQFGRFCVIHYYENNGYGAQHYVDYCKAKPYRYARHYVPRDARAREWLTSGPDGKAKMRIQVLAEAFDAEVKVVKDHRMQDGINAARNLIEMAHFEEGDDGCGHGLECLRQYRKEWDDEKKVFKDTPLHDWASHGSDAWRYLAIAAREIEPPAPKLEKPPVGIMDATWKQALAMQRPRSGRIG